MYLRVHARCVCAFLCIFGVLEGGGCWKESMGCFSRLCVSMPLYVFDGGIYVYRSAEGMLATGFSIRGSASRSVRVLEGSKGQDR